MNLSVFLELKSHIIFMQLSINISIFTENEVRYFLTSLIKLHGKYFFPLSELNLQLQNVLFCVLLNIRFIEV